MVNVKSKLFKALAFGSITKLVGLAQIFSGSLVRMVQREGEGADPLDFLMADLLLQ